MEGLAFGQAITDNGQLFHTLYLANDNDFDANTSGTNRFYVFAIADNTLNYPPQQFTTVPQPTSAWLFISGLIGLIVRRIPHAAQ